MARQIIDALIQGLERLIDKVGFWPALFAVWLLIVTSGFLLVGPRFVRIILFHRRESRRIDAKIKRENEKLKSDLSRVETAERLKRRSK